VWFGAVLREGRRRYTLFFCPTLSKRFGTYHVEGCIGVIHQGFERNWAKKYPGHLSEHAFGVTIHILNFSELRESGCIAYEGPFETPAERFCAAVVTILDRLPVNEDHLFDAFSEGRFGWKARGYVFRLGSHREIQRIQGFREAPLPTSLETSIALRGIAPQTHNFIVGIRSSIGMRLFLASCILALAIHRRLRRTSKQTMETV
jgi:hypothetical protein